MTADKQDREPSMEEILASIRRIISQEGAPPAEAVPEPAAVAPVAAPVAAMAAAPEEDVLELTQEAEEPVVVAPAPPPEPVMAPPPPPPPPPPAPEPLPEVFMAPPVVANQGAAITGVINSVQLAAESSEWPLGHPGMTVEGLMRELMQPLLKQWMDQNLPAMVERLVQAEIERMVSRAKNRNAA